MTGEEWRAFITDWYQQCIEITCQRGAAYAGQEDTIAEWKLVAAWVGIPASRLLFTIALTKMARFWQAVSADAVCNIEGLADSIRDIQNYLALCYMALMEEMEADKCESP